MNPEGFYTIAIGHCEDQGDYTVDYGESPFGRVARKVGHFVSATLFSVGLACLFQTHNLMFNGTISMVGLVGLAFSDNRGSKATMISDHILQQWNKGYRNFHLITSSDEDFEIANIALSRLPEEVTKEMAMLRYDNRNELQDV